MTAEWHQKTLAEACEVFADGDWIESKDQSSTGIRLIQTGNVGEGAFKDRDDKARYISPATFERLRCTEIFANDCLISRLPDPVGRSCLLPDVGERMITAVDCTIVRFKPGGVLPEFFNYYSQSDAYVSTVDRECTGTTRKRISRSRLGLIPIPVPPVEEQRRIVGMLDEAFAGIAAAKANYEANLRNARALFESHLQSVFSQRGDGWVERTLDEICIIGDGNHSANYPRKDELAEEGVPFIRATNLVRGRISGVDMRFLTPQKHMQLKKGHLKTGDVLITNRGEIGKAAIVDPDYNGANLNSQIAWLRCRQGVHSKFLFHALNSPNIQRHFQASKSGAALQQFTIKQLKALKVPSPTLPEQEALLNQLDGLNEATQRLESIHQQKLDALDALKKSLLHDAFRGAL